MPHSHLIDPSDWIQLALALAAWLVVVAAYGLATVLVAAQSRRPV